MKLSVLFGMLVIVLFDVVRSQYRRAYGLSGIDSIEYILLILLGLLILFYAFPEWDC